MTRDVKIEKLDKNRGADRRGFFIDGNLLKFFYILWPSLNRQLD